jgi:hypothetical protein
LFITQRHDGVKRSLPISLRWRSGDQQRHVRVGKLTVLEQRRDQHTKLMLPAHNDPDCRAMRAHRTRVPPVLYAIAIAGGSAALRQHHCFRVFACPLPLPPAGAPFRPFPRRARHRREDRGWQD